VAHVGANPPSGTWCGIPAVVSRYAARGGAPGSLMPQVCDALRHTPCTWAYGITVGCGRAERAAAPGGQTPGLRRAVGVVLPSSRRRLRVSLFYSLPRRGRSLQEHVPHSLGRVTGASRTSSTPALPAQCCSGVRHPGRQRCRVLHHRHRWGG